jgi:HlyD family secretion protein
MKLKPGMTANITLTVDQRNDVLKTPNAALRYTPPGVVREDVRAENIPISTAEIDAEAPQQAARRAALPEIALAPGQKWDTSRKIKFAAPRRAVQRPGTVFVLTAEQKPVPRKVLLGITDGSATEVISGEITPGERVIIGDSSQAPQTSATPTGGPPFFGGGFGPRGGGRGN